MAYEIKQTHVLTKVHKNFLARACFIGDTDVRVGVPNENDGSTGTSGESSGTGVVRGTLAYNTVCKICSRNTVVGENL